MTTALPVTVQRRRAGTGSSPLRVLLLHGLAGGANIWDAYLEQAAPGPEMWTAELPWRADGIAAWHARPPTGWAAEAFGLVPGGPEVIVAHSFAANVLLALLDEQDAPHPDRAGDEDAFARHGLRAVVLVSPFYRPDLGDFNWETISYYLNRFDLILEDGLRVQSKGRLAPDIQHEMALKVRERIGPYGWVNFFRTYLGTPGLRTDRMQGPCMVIGGERDFASYPSDSQALSKALPDADLHLLPDCGHFAMVEQAARFTALTDNFLQHAADRQRLRREQTFTDDIGVTAR